MSDLTGKKLLLLAGADVHCKVVAAAQALGVYTIVTDYLAPEDSPAKQIADEWWNYDIFDVDSIVSRCREESVDGVLAVCIDPAQKPYQQICESLGVPCYGTREQFEVFTNKRSFKEVCVRNGLRIIPTYTLQDILSDNAECPLLVKPSESRGSRGQSVCQTKNEAISAVERARAESVDGEAVIEKYMADYQDFSLSYLVIDGKAYLIKVGDRFDGSKADGLDRQHILTVSPSVQVDRFLQVTQPAIDDFVASLGIRFAPLFFQGFIKDGEVYFYDPGLRLPGSDFDMATLRATGFDAMKTLVEFALTGDPTACYGDPRRAWPMQGGVGVILSIAARPGVVGAMQGFDSLWDNQSICSVSYRKKPGDAIPASGDIQQRVAEVVAWLESRSELAEFLDAVYSSISVTDESGADMMISKASIVDGSIVIN